MVKFPAQFPAKTVLYALMFNILSHQFIYSNSFIAGQKYDMFLKATIIGKSFK